MYSAYQSISQFIPVAHDMLHVISVRCVARDLHTIAPGRLCIRVGEFATQGEVCRNLELRLSMRSVLLSLPDQLHAAKFAYVSRHILGRTEGHGVGFGQLVRNHTGWSLKWQFFSDAHSDRKFE